MRKITFVLVVFFLFTSNFPVFAADVVINEFSSSTTQDWIELYNTSTASASLSNLRLRDSSTNKKDLTGEISPSGFEVITFSKWLNNDGDIVKLIEVQGETEITLEQIPYGTAGGLCVPTGEGSIGKFPDGSSTVKRFITYTQKASNNSSQEDPCPTPTPTPTVTPTPTPLSPTDTSSPSSTPQPQSSPTVRSSATPTKKPGVTPRVYDPDAEAVTPRQEPTGTVLGETTNSTDNNAKDKPTNNRQGISLLLLLLLIGGGVGCIAGAVMLSTRQIRRRRVV